MRLICRSAVLAAVLVLVLPASAQAPQNVHIAAWNLCVPVPPGWTSHPDSDHQGVTLTEGKLRMSFRVSTHTVPTATRRQASGIDYILQNQVGTKDRVLTTTSIDVQGKNGRNTVIERNGRSFERIVVTPFENGDPATFYVFRLHAPSRSALHANAQLFRRELDSLDLRCRR